MKRQNSNFLLYIGHDEIFLASLVLGIGNAIGSTYNFMGNVFVKIKENFANGNIDKARQLQISANDMIEALLKTGVNPGVKYILQLIGIDVGECKSPFKSLCDDEKQMLKLAFEKLRKEAF